MSVDHEPEVRNIGANGIRLSYFEWNDAGSAAGPTLVFAHATGFHARVFDAVIAHFPRHHVLSLDLRGHGRSTGEAVKHWGEIVGDVTALFDALDISDAVGIGHSMGAHVLLQAAYDRSGAMEKLVLFDPVVLAPEFYLTNVPLFTSDDPHPASRRKRAFTSPQAMMDRFADRDPYNLFNRRVFEDYCRYGLIEVEGGYELACAPEVEASIYASSRSNSGILDAARSVDIPVTVVRARQTEFHDFKSSPTWPELASIMPRGQDIHRPDTTHFHPFQDPTDAARIISEAMAG